jgi:DivIVA domain-containing protein
MARKKQKQGKGEDPATVAEPRHITPVEIQQKEFRVAMRGYHERDVDQFLDEVTEEVARLHAENRRLREELEFAGTRRMDIAGGQEAEAILRSAREEADRLLAEARARAATHRSGTAPSGTASARASADLGPFIVREREFLQSLADLIQSHAEAVKQQLLRAREEGAPDEPGASAPSQPSGRDRSTQPWTMAPDRGGPAGPVPAETEPPDAGPPETESPDAGPPETGLPMSSGQSSFRDRAEPEIAGQDWSQYSSGPVGPADPPGSFAPSESDDDILDLTGSSRSDEDDAEDRSLRELFWGED